MKNVFYYSLKDIFKPWIDEHGLWIYMKVSYDGKLQMTLNAKLKWNRKNRIIDQSSIKKISLSNSKRKSDLEQGIPIKKTWRKRLWPPTHWFRRSNYENLNKNHSLSYLEEDLPKISKTTIVIKLEMNNLNGILLFNIPPIPSDRIWISFFEMPEMKFSV
jgi:hypothetical protein